AHRGRRVRPRPRASRRTVVSGLVPSRDRPWRVLCRAGRSDQGKNAECRFSTQHRSRREHRRIPEASSRRRPAPGSIGRALACGRDIERNIAQCRVVLSIAAFVTVYVDPTRPTLTRWLPLSGGPFTLDPYAVAVLLAHVGYSIAILF